MLFYDRLGGAASQSPFPNSSRYMYLTGGESYTNKTTEVLTDDGWELIEPSLPVSITHHCMTLMNSTTVILIGGSQNGLSQTYILNTENDAAAWVKGPNLNNEDYPFKPVCGKIRLSQKSIKFGVIYAGFEQSTEILEDADAQWHYGPEVPFRLVGFSLVEAPLGKAYYK